MRSFDRQPTDNSVISIGPAKHVVGFYCQNFLQSMRRAIAFERPDFHFTKTLSAKLRFPAERLLSYQRIRPYGTHMNFIFHQMMQFHYIYIADCNFLAKWLPGLPVMQDQFSVFWISRFFKFFLNFIFRSAIERRSLRQITQSMSR